MSDTITLNQWRTVQRAEPQLGYYVQVPSEANSSSIHTVYTGDSVNPPHCTCKNFQFGEREAGVLFSCKHIRLVVYGEGSS